jgi:hypothetical protein
MEIELNSREKGEYKDDIHNLEKFIEENITKSISPNLYNQLITDIKSIKEEIKIILKQIIGKK